MSKSILSQIREQIDKDDDERINIELYKHVYTDRMIKNCDKTCPKCKGNNVNCITKQVRSADEGATVFYECPACGYRFTQNN